MANTNKELTQAKKGKKDEFYTRLEDIEKELSHYRKYFKDRIIFCNCDDPYESNFFKYFAMNFNYFGLKKLIATCYVSSPVAYTQLSLFDIEGLKIEKKDVNKAYKIEITEVEDNNSDGAIDFSDVEYLIKNKKNTLTLLKGDGDFRSDECIELLQEADIVVTNPPFSLFRDFINLMDKYNKDFIVISNTNSLTYKDVFKMFMNNKLRTGYTNFNVGMFFAVPDSTEKYHKFENGKKYVRVAASCWLTTLPVDKHNEKLILFKKLNENTYPVLLNCEGINIDTYIDIPVDYYKYMAVPVTFLDKYNEKQFRIVGCADANILPDEWKGMSEDFVKLYYEQGNTGSYKAGNRLTCYITSDGKAVVPYKRVIIIRNDLEEFENGN